MIGPRSVAAKLFAAIVIVSIAALGAGAWLLQRAVHLEVSEQVTVTAKPGGGQNRDVTRVVRTGDEDAQARSHRVLAALAIVLAGTTIATVLLARRIVRPLAALQAAAERMTHGDLAARVDPRGSDELAALGGAFNTLADRLDANERLRRDLTNDVAHELRTPLTALRCHVEALHDGVQPFSSDTAAALLADLAHLQRLVDDLADLARADAGQLTLDVDSVALAPVMDEIAADLRPKLAARTLTLDVAPTLPSVRADRTRLRQVVRNVIDNAIVHTPDGVRIDVRARAHGAFVRIAVADTGPGIPPDRLPHVFERFYRGDPSRSRETGGTGLGLAIARQLVLAHGGAIAVESAASGTRLVIDWPAS